MNSSEFEIIEKWQSDPSFINWVSNDNDSDVAKWNAYFEAHPEQLEMAAIAKFSMKLKPKPILRDREKSLTALSNLQAKISASSKRSTPKTALLPFAKFARIAASLLFLVACFWGYTALNDHGEEIVFTTQKDQKELVLEDGTKVILNAYSSLRYFEKEERNVQLTGEAYFNVTKKPASGAAFQVTTQDLTVTVLGTEFNVNSENGQTSVYLDEGKVRLQLGDNSSNEIQMEPGELVSYSKRKNKVLENRKVKSLEKTAWKEKIILFEEATIAEVLNTVSLVYKVTLETSASVEQDQLFTGGIPANDLDITLQTLKDIYHLNINKYEEKYIIEQAK